KRPSTHSSMISLTDTDVNLPVQAGGLSLGQSVSTVAGGFTLHVALAAFPTPRSSDLGTGLQLLGSGTVNLDQAANNVVTLAASCSGAISDPAVKGLALGTFTDTAMSPSTTTSGITSTGNDVKLTVQAGGLSIGQAVSTG